MPGGDDSCRQVERPLFSVLGFLPTSRRRLKKSCTSPQWEQLLILSQREAPSPEVGPAPTPKQFQEVFLRRGFWQEELIAAGAVMMIRAAGEEAVAAALDVPVPWHGDWSRAL